MRRDEAVRLLAAHRAELEAMGVTSLALFGSVARDEAGPDSDVDVIIDVRRPFSLFDLANVHLRLEEIMGEAARHVPIEVQARCPEVAWRLMNDMRNVLIHAYPRVDLGAV
jgi:predicted nucleotidyltransferase